MTPVIQVLPGIEFRVYPGRKTTGMEVGLPFNILILFLFSLLTTANAEDLTYAALEQSNVKYFLLPAIAGGTLEVENTYAHDDKNDNPLIVGFDILGRSLYKNFVFEIGYRAVFDTDIFDTTAGYFLGEYQMFAGYRFPVSVSRFLTVKTGKLFWKFRAEKAQFLKSQAEIKTYKGTDPVYGIDIETKIDKTSKTKYIL